ncbi:unnamed protein product [Prunus armeniaca]|uniref:Uncharacterized protein n=1 Tax=Prunus armeniaca TaxID=36596 RepID=A0A6J5TJ56_PRUAR|nr:unnamed protein product [Prunus armeniaca]
MPQLRDFGEALDDCVLKVINYTRYKFTWTNRWQGEGNVRYAYSSYNSFVSDNLPTLLIFGVSNTRRRHRRFTFEEMWTLIDGCQETITQAWGGEVGIVVDKIMSCQTSLLSWNMV